MARQGEREMVINALRGAHLNGFDGRLVGLRCSVLSSLKQHPISEEEALVRDSH
jgi:hypothetical protein